mgnify:CR=1 FL=1
MFFRNRNKKSSVDTVFLRQQEERLYKIILVEMEAGIRRDGLWGKALTKANFDEKDAKAIYVKLRMQSLIDEELIAERLAKEKKELEERIIKEQEIIKKQKEEEQLPAFEEKALELVAQGYLKKEFEAWFFTTEYTHRDYDSQYKRFHQLQLLKASIIHNK